MTAQDDRKHYCSRCLTTFGEDVDQCPNLSCRRKRPSRGWGVIFSEGDLFDRTYRIHKMLAVGGAGVTYLGRELDGQNEEVGPRIAIKVLLAARDQGPYVRRLATEAQIIQELDHPNMVQYLGFVHRAGHSPYLLTRFEAGGSLLDHMRRVGTLPVAKAALVGRQICWALEKAHERGIVHRDLKPENVLLTRVVTPEEDPVLRVADFGIAKVQGSLGTNLTRVGAFVGTPHYAAPEQFVGGAVTEAADVYALGAMLYFTMTAKHVVRFADRIDPEDGFQLLCDNLPPKLERPGESADDLRRMQMVLASAMEVDPLARCSVVELDQMLQAVAAGQEPQLPERSGGDDVVGPAGASVLGVAAAAESVEPEVPASPPPSPPPVATEDAPPPEPAAPRPRESATEPVPSPTPPAPPPKKAEPSKGWSFGGMVAMVALVVGGGTVVLGGGGVAAIALSRPDLLDSAKEQVGLGPEPLPEAPALVADSPAAQRDLQGIQSSLDAQRSSLRDACGLKKGFSVEVTVVVDGAGQVLGAEAGKSKAAQCVADALRGTTVSRAGSDTVSVTYPMRW